MTEESGRERKRLKTRTKKDAKPIPKTKTTKDSPSQVAQEPSSDPPARIKTPKKRKRSEDGVALDGSERNVAEPKPRKYKTRDKTQEKDQMCHPSYPDPADDESLSEQSRKALSYSHERWRGIDTWKFNKARQNWLLRNIWSEQAVPESYVGLVIEYLAGIQGGAREKLIEECISKASASEEVPIQSAKAPEDSSENQNKITDESTTNKRPGASRTQCLLRALRKT